MDNGDAWQKMDRELTPDEKPDDQETTIDQVGNRGHDDPLQDLEAMMDAMVSDAHPVPQTKR